MELDLHIPTRIVLQAGAIDRTGALTRPHGRRALLVTGRTAVRANGYLDRVLASLEAAGVSASVYDRVSANPRSDEVDEAAAQARAAGCDVVVAVGGGSAIDAAKGAAVAAASGITVRDVIGVTLEQAQPVLPIVALPTTAGSGSEVTKGAIITDAARGFRSGVRGDALFPQVAIVDPDVIASVPPKVLAETAFDAFAHAVEGCAAVRANPLSRALAHRAIELIARHLPGMLRGDNRPEAREGLCLAALLGGVNVATVSTCLPHRLQQAMGSVRGLDISHGRGLAAVYPSWLRHTAPVTADVFQEVADLLGGPTVHDAVGRLLEDAGLAVRLRDWGVSKEDLDTLVAGVSGNLDNDPAPAVDGDYLRTIFAESL
ncbi:iron-containing alcohol dehydrogenase [Streptomyces sp. NPDC058401]|uniref:iron-containing alcohol dehydrogenase n=1 Tax=Streptomyces sp. NPDC058401 TaxID=3346480 RepID=UPI00365BC75C